MQRKDILDYISNLDISNVLIYDLKKYTNYFFDKYFEVADLYKAGSYYNSQLDELRIMYIEISTYLYALYRSGILNGNVFSYFEEIYWNMYNSLEVSK